MHAGEVLYRAWQLGHPLTYAPGEGLRIPRELPAAIQSAARAHSEELCAILGDSLLALREGLTDGECLVARLLCCELRDRGVPLALADKISSWAVRSRLGRYRYPTERPPRPADDVALARRATLAIRNRARARYQRAA